MDLNVLEPEDYEEPRCPLAMKTPADEAALGAVPQQRIIAKLDEHMAHRDYAAAERHLLYWLDEALLAHDLRGQLMLHNELAGHYRKIGDEAKAVANAEAALGLLDPLDFEGTVSSGTTYVNAATVYNAFGHNERSLELFEQARAAYEAAGSTDAALLGGLYNNMGLCYCALANYDEALLAYNKAIDCMAGVDTGALEQAITKLNIAELLERRDGMEAAEAAIYDLLDEAHTLLVSCTQAPAGYRAFVYEKCAPTFEYYGYFAVAAQLKQDAERLYERP